jgi:rubrerythrin
MSDFAKSIVIDFWDTVAEMSPSFTETADKERFAEIATVFRKIAVAEKLSSPVS